MGTVYRAGSLPGGVGHFRSKLLCSTLESTTEICAGGRCDRCVYHTDGCKKYEYSWSAQAVLFIVVAQMITAYVIELLGWFGTEKADWSMQKLIGMAIAITGVVIFQWERK